MFYLSSLCAPQPTTSRGTPDVVPLFSLCAPQPTILEDLIMGGSAGACAAATTTPLDVVKTRMMCSASQRPTFIKVRTGLSWVLDVKGLWRGNSVKGLWGGAGYVGAQGAIKGWQL
eukprot:1143240-Pelagomonas_calceolata.AAC.8